MGASHDESQRSPTGRPAEGGPGREGHQCRGRGGPAPERPPVHPGEASRPGRRGAGLVPPPAGAALPRRLPADIRARVATLLQTTYVDVNDCHATEKLREVDDLLVSRASVRRIRRSLDLPAKHRRRPRQHRARRTPEARMGALVQLDGSPHAWLEGRGPVMTLLGAIDDATQPGLPLTFYGDPPRPLRPLLRGPPRRPPRVCRWPAPGRPRRPTAGQPAHTRAGLRPHAPQQASRRTDASPTCLQDRVDGRGPPSGYSPDTAFAPLEAPPHSLRPGRAPRRHASLAPSLQTPHPSPRGDILTEQLG